MAFPISLATTLGISIDFFSSGYLDVSVLQVRHTSFVGKSLIIFSGILYVETPIGLFVSLKVYSTIVLFFSLQFHNPYRENLLQL